MTIIDLDKKRAATVGVDDLDWNFTCGKCGKTAHRTAYIPEGTNIRLCAGCKRKFVEFCAERIGGMQDKWLKEFMTEEQK